MHHSRQHGARSALASCVQKIHILRCPRMSHLVSCLLLGPRIIQIELKLDLDRLSQSGYAKQLEENIKLPKTTCRRLSSRPLHIMLIWIRTYDPKEKSSRVELRSGRSGNIRMAAVGEVIGLLREKPCMGSCVQ